MIQLNLGSELLEDRLVHIDQKQFGLLTRHRFHFEVLSLLSLSIELIWVFVKTLRVSTRASLLHMATHKPLLSKSAVPDQFFFNLAENFILIKKLSLILVTPVNLLLGRISCVSCLDRHLIRAHARYTSVFTLGDNEQIP